VQDIDPDKRKAQADDHSTQQEKTVPAVKDLIVKRYAVIAKQNP
jgi:hypothetical protein